ncbi:MAG: DUF1365 family protein [Planctomycetota bacterium]
MSSTALVHSGIYRGGVRHRRFDAIDRSFSVRLDLAYLDVDEIKQAFQGRWFWSDRRLAPVRFRRADYFGCKDMPLREAVCDAVEERLGFRPDGAVRLLTALRCFGYGFNPVSFYYCFDQQDQLVAVLAEITNTPWHERHHYILPADEKGQVVARFAKDFHVSPFQPMDHEYLWRFSAPGKRLLVHMENHAAGSKAFDVTLVMSKQPWRTGTLVRSWLRNPMISLKIILTIYWQALRLWMRRAPFYAHPRRRVQP